MGITTVSPVQSAPVTWGQMIQIGHRRTAAVEVIALRWTHLGGSLELRSQFSHSFFSGVVGISRWSGHLCQSRRKRPILNRCLTLFFDVQHVLWSERRTDVPCFVDTLFRAAFCRKHRDVTETADSGLVSFSSCELFACLCLERG